MKLINRIQELYNRKYDYYYLKSILEREKIGKQKTTTIFAGSSYSILGINPKDGQICIGLPSQDWYYSDKLIRKVISYNNNIKKVIFITGYYTAYCDLSLSKSYSEQLKIEDVYDALLNDEHNRDNVQKQTSLRKKLAIIFDQIILTIQKSVFFKAPLYIYFNNKRMTRENKKRITWENNKKKWFELEEQERIQAGLMRALGHSKFLKYEKSFCENKNILIELYGLLKSQNIKFLVYIAPFSKEYLTGMTEEFKKKATENIRLLESNSDYFYDFNHLTYIEKNYQDINSFENQDFIDADHLSDLGAYKMTNKINDDINSI